MILIVCVGVCTYIQLSRLKINQITITVININIIAQLFGIIEFDFFFHFYISMSKNKTNETIVLILIYNIKMLVLIVVSIRHSTKNSDENVH